jgi:hypothetical protein
MTPVVLAKEKPRFSADFRFRWNDLLIVIPAKRSASRDPAFRRKQDWIPAFLGMSPKPPFVIRAKNLEST